MNKVLLIGDRLANDPALKQALDAEKMHALLAEGRSDGLECLRASQPELVIIDHQLDGGKGVDLLTEIRNADPVCEAILITDGGEMDAAIEALRAGALDYLRRPLDDETLRLALGRARERAQRRAAVEPATVLILDDHEPTRRRLVRILEKEGYRVYGGADGEEGMEILADKRVDLMLLDLRMPKKDGLTVLRETKGAGADIEVIVTTGYGDEDIVVQALRDGAINFLRKPVDIDQMLLAIEKAIDYQRVRRSLAYRNRDIELMQDLVVRLTSRLELIVETPEALNPQTIDFLHQLVDALPFGIIVVDADQKITFANRQVSETNAQGGHQVTAQWLKPMGIANITDEALSAGIARTLRSPPGTVDTMMVSDWAFLLMTPIKLIKGGSPIRYVAVAVRGERR